jgi:hypothetical protein
VLATGSRLEVGCDPLLAGVQEAKPIEIVGGMPALEPTLRWRHDCEVYVMGVFAGLQVRAFFSSIDLFFFFSSLISFTSSSTLLSTSLSSAPTPSTSPARARARRASTTHSTPQCATA